MIVLWSAGHLWTEPLRLGYHWSRISVTWGLALEPRTEGLLVSLHLLQWGFCRWDFSLMGPHLPPPPSDFRELPQAPWARDPAACLLLHVCRHLPGGLPLLLLSVGDLGTAQEVPRGAGYWGEMDGPNVGRCLSHSHAVYVRMTGRE